MAPFTPDFTFLLDDLGRLDPSAIHARTQLSAMARVVLFALQRARHADDLVHEFETWVELIRELASRPNGPDDWALVVRYTYYVADIAPERMRALLRGRVSPEVEEVLMTTAERLVAEGKAQGRAEGEARGRAALLLEQLALRYGELPTQLKERVRDASVAELDRWGRRFVTESSLEGIFA